MTKPIIRLATLNDLQRIQEIYAPNVLNSPISFEYEVPSIEELRQRMTDVMKKYPWLVYEVEGQVLGYVYTSPHRGRRAYDWSAECSVFVDYAHRGKGIGRALYQELFRIIKGQGVVNVFAGISLPNAASVGIHEALGFKQVSTLKDVGYKLDKWWDVGWWQLQFEKPEKPADIRAYVSESA